MKISPSAGVNLSRFDKPTDELDVLYGLPRTVHFCTACNMSNQQPMSSNEYSHNKFVGRFVEARQVHAGAGTAEAPA